MSFVEGDIVKDRVTHDLYVVMCLPEECVSHNSNFECVLSDYNCSYDNNDYLVVKTEFGTQTIVHESEVSRVNLYEMI